MLSLLLLLACGSKAPETAPPTPDQVEWLTLDPGGPRLCLSPVSEGERLSKSERTTLAAARKAVAMGESVSISDLPEHPAREVVRGALLVQSGALEPAREVFRDLGNTWQDDPCIQQAAGLLSMLAGRTTYARPYVDAAQASWPGEPDVALLAAAYMAGVDGKLDEAMSLVRPALAQHPEHLPSQAWLGRALARRGRMDEALPHLQAAWKGGIDVAAELAVVSRVTGDEATYLSLVGVSPPLPVDLRGSADPIGAYKQALGIVDGQPLVAEIRTSMGTLECELYWRQAPLTVGNFVALSRGLVPWTDPLTGEARTGPLYDGVLFHRVIPGFMVQAGDPSGTGAGGPGWAFFDETHPELRFDRPGLLAMANSGPNTNGSQWFVTEVPVPHLDGKHTIFGACTPESMAVVKAIAGVRTDREDKPLADVVIEHIRIR